MEICPGHGWHTLFPNLELAIFGDELCYDVSFWFQHTQKNNHRTNYDGGETAENQAEAETCNRRQTRKTSMTHLAHGISVDFAHD